MKGSDRLILQSRWGYVASASKSVVLHAMLAAVLYWTFTSPLFRPAIIPSVQPKYIEAVLVDRAVEEQAAKIKPEEIKPKPAPKPVPPKPVEEPPAVQKKMPIVKKQPDQKSEPKKTETKPAEISKKPKPVPAPVSELKSSDFSTLLEEETAEIEAFEQSLQQQKKQQAEAVSKMMSIVQQHHALIRAKVQQYWSRPPSARNGMKAVVRVKLLPGGEVYSVDLVDSSGDDAYDRSVLRAIQMAKTLPVPEDPAVFNQYFKVSKFIFRPEDLRL